MQSEIMVTVLCTAYNHEAYIRTCLDGMVGQVTDFKYEILINDDVSSDGTAAIIREYAERCPDKIRAFFPEKNLYSQGINVYDAVFFPAARGKYTAICEGDDYWTDPTKLQRQVDFLEAHPEYSACVHDTELLFCDGARPDEKLVSHGEDCDIEFADILQGMNHAFHTSSILGKTALLAETPDFYHVADSYGFTDFPYALWLRLNGKIRCLARVMSVYRLNSGADSWSSDKEAQTRKLTRFYRGVIAMLEAFRGHVRDEALLKLVDENLVRWNFDLLYILGRDKELRSPPYRAILKTKPLSFRVKNAVKCAFPALHRLYRKARGYNE